MAVIEVVCPNPACGARLKAPEDRIGKKAKCNKCGEGFRVPGPVPMAESVEEPLLSSMALPVPALPEPPKAKPAANLADLPSADPFDFAAPAKPAFGSGTPAKPAPKPAPPAPAAAAAPAKPTKPAARPAPAEEPIPEADLDEEPPAGKPKAKAKKAADPIPEPEPLPEPAPADNPFSFGATDEPAGKPKKSKRRDEEEDEDEDERPRKKKRDASEEAEEKPRKKKRDEENEREDEDDKPRKKRDAKEESNTKAEPAPADNPFSFGFGDEPAPEKPKKAKRRTEGEDDEDEDKPRKKKRATEEDEDDEPRKKKRDASDEADKKPKKPEPEPAPGGDPFSFGLSDEPEPEKPKKSKRRDEEEDTEGDKPRKKKRDEENEDKPRKKKRDEDADDDDKPRKRKRATAGEGEEEGDDKPRYLRPEEKGGMGKALLLSGAVALVALGLAATAGVMYLRSKPPTEAKKEEKKEEQPPPVTLPPVVTPPVTPKDKVEPKPKDKEPEPKPKDKEPEPKPKDKEPEPVPARPAVVLDGKFRSVTVGKEPAKFERADQPGEPRFTLDTPFASVVQVFPPFDPKASDAYVLTRTGVRYTLDALSPSSGARVSRLEFAADPKPLCDVFATATDARFLAVSAGRVTVWKLADQTKLADAIDPYADKPAHAKNGLAAVYFSPNPERVVTVSTAGAVHLFDLGTKTVVAEFVPPHGVKGAVVQGESVTRGGADSVALAVGGIVYQIKSADLARVRAHDLGGDVKPLAIASAGAPGRLAFAFEAEFKGKKEKERVLLALPFQGDQRNIFLLPAASGTPRGAFWVHDTEVGIVTERGVVWFGEDEGKFGPVVATRPAADGLYAGSGGFFWLLVPRPTNAAQSFLVPLAVPFGDAAEYRGAGAGKPLRVVRIDQNGLAK